MRGFWRERKVFGVSGQEKDRRGGDGVERLKEKRSHLEGEGLFVQCQPLELRSFWKLMRSVELISFLFLPFFLSFPLLLFIWKK